MDKNRQSSILRGLVDCMRFAEFPVINLPNVFCLIHYETFAENSLTNLLRYTWTRAIPRKFIETLENEKLWHFIVFELLLRCQKKYLTVNRTRYYCRLSISTRWRPLGHCQQLCCYCYRCKQLNIPSFCDYENAMESIKELIDETNVCDEVVSEKRIVVFTCVASLIWRYSKRPICGYEAHLLCNFQHNWLMPQFAQNVIRLNNRCELQVSFFFLLF